MDWTKNIKKLFRKHKVLTLEEVRHGLGGRSRASIFRDLCEVGYLSSYSHKGKCFTLQGIPAFNEEGLWHFGEVGFSRFGTLKKTVGVLVERSEAGHTPPELEQLLGVRVYNALLTLVSEGVITRTNIAGRYVYVSKEPKQANGQLARRQTLVQRAQPITAVVPSASVIEVLLEVIRANHAVAAVRDITSRLVKRGIDIAERQVEQVLEYFEVKKSPPSK